MHNRSREEWAKGVHSNTQVTKRPAYSQKLEECPKAKENIELGLELILFKYYNAWLTRSHVAMQYFVTMGKFSIVYMNNHEELM